MHCPECGNKLSPEGDTRLVCPMCKKNWSEMFVSGYWLGYNDAKRAAQHRVNSDVGDSAAPKILIHPEADIPAPDFSTPAPRGLR